MIISLDGEVFGSTFFISDIFIIIIDIKDKLCFQDKQDHFIFIIIIDIKYKLCFKNEYS